MPFVRSSKCNESRVDKVIDGHEQCYFYPKPKKKSYKILTKDINRLNIWMVIMVCFPSSYFSSFFFQNFTT